MAVPSSPLISFPLEPASWAAAVDLLWSLGARPRIPEPLERIRDVRNVRTWQLEKGMLALNFRAPDGSVEVDLWHSTTAAAARGWPNASSPAAFAKFRGRIKTTFGIGNVRSISRVERSVPSERTKKPLPWLLSVSMTTMAGDARSTTAGHGSWAAVTPNSERARAVKATIRRRMTSTPSDFRLTPCRSAASGDSRLIYPQSARRSSAAAAS